jgi:hypothetical protein
MRPTLTELSNLVIEVQTLDTQAILESVGTSVDQCATTASLEGCDTQFETFAGSRRNLPGGEKARFVLPIPPPNTSPSSTAITSSYEDGILDPNEHTVHVRFDLCLLRLERFTLEVNVLGVIGPDPL